MNLQFYRPWIYLSVLFHLLFLPVTSYADRGNDPTGPSGGSSDTDGDLLEDGDDADPLDPLVDWHRAPESSYILIDVTAPSGAGTVQDLNDKGDVLFSNGLWSNGVWGSREISPITGPTANGTYNSVFYGWTYLGDDRRLVGDSNISYPEPYIIDHDQTSILSWTAPGNPVDFAARLPLWNYVDASLALIGIKGDGKTIAELTYYEDIDPSPAYDYIEHKNFAMLSANGTLQTFFGESNYYQPAFASFYPSTRVSPSGWVVSAMKAIDSAASSPYKLALWNPQLEEVGLPTEASQDYYKINLTELPNQRISITATSGMDFDTHVFLQDKDGHIQHAPKLSGKHLQVLSPDGTGMTSDGKLWRNGKLKPLRELCEKFKELEDDGYSMLPLKANKNGVYLIQAQGPNGEQKALLLLPVEIKAFKRGTLNAPGSEVPAGTGEFGYETVMMENADSESSATSTSRDCDESGAAADLNTYRKTNDDDLVKIVLKWPAGIKPAGASLKLLHNGMQVDATQTTADAAVSTSGPSRLNFYKADGTRITNPTTDLQIADLANAPASSYLSKILTDGEVTIFIEGADRFGDLPDNPTLLGGTQLKWECSVGGTTASAKLLVYRGGFLRFMQPPGAPGTVGDFEFWDGKGRVKHKVGKPIFGKEFETDVTDYGTKLTTWKAKSGKTIDNPVIPGKSYDVNGGYGHTPPGWWETERRTDFTGPQPDKISGNGSDKKIKQGGYVRWKQDDETAAANRYTTPYRYDASNAHDAAIGEPTAIRFKFDMTAIAPGTAQGRTDIQIHPDGECADNVMGGTAGCIGIQTYNDCLKVDGILQRFHGLKVKVQLK
ncbi:MAG: hypothetical protein ABI600_14935 [Luteolibacter sp.]